MKKGFINFNDTKIPFILDKEYKLELFGEPHILSSFSKTYNFKKDYVLSGQCIDNGYMEREIILTVKYSISNICYINSYAIANSNKKLCFDEIIFSSKMINDIFQFNYNARQLSEKGVDLTKTLTTIYSDTFLIGDTKYDLKYSIGGRKIWPFPLDRMKINGELSISSLKSDILECSKICILIERFIKFMCAYADIIIDKIILMSNNFPIGHLYFNFKNKTDYHSDEIFFLETTPQSYCSKILDNLSLNLSNNISVSIPLGHIRNNTNKQSPQRFIEQIFSFEYIYAKLNPGEKSKRKQKSLEEKLKKYFDEYNDIINLKTFSAKKNYPNLIKELRRQITHGEKYYYEFKEYEEEYTYMIILDSLIEAMSLSYMGFTHTEIKKFRSPYFV